MRPCCLAVILAVLFWGVLGQAGVRAAPACTCKVDPKPPYPLPACVKPRPQEQPIRSLKDCAHACPDGTQAIWAESLDRQFACAKEGRT